jgi:hypothetical protein
MAPGLQSIMKQPKRRLHTGTSVPVCVQSTFGLLHNAHVSRTWLTNVAHKLCSRMCLFDVPYEHISITRLISETKNSQYVTGFKPSHSRTGVLRRCVIVKKTDF